MPMQYSPGTWGNPVPVPQMTWSPNTQYPQPSTYSGSGSHVQQPVNNLLRVTGPESAKAYPLPPNSSVVLFDGENPIFYLKSTDDSGFATLREFEFMEKAKQEPAPQAVGQDAVKELQDEISSIKSDISEMRELLEGLVR